MRETPAPSALLFIGSGCAHCPAVLDGLVRLVKEGRLARLEVVNLTVEPKLGQRHDVGTVPWTRIGPFELYGALSPNELSDWVDYAAAGEGWSAYYAHLLENRRLDEVVERIRACPSTLVDLLNLLTSEETSMATRIGISAVMEELPDSKALADAVPELEQLTLSESAQTRADACHFLGLTGDRRAVPAVRRLLDDEQADVREIAMETLAILGEDGPEQPT
ncbi:MAG: HEAT repeat domain-containing protein [Pseudomonadota bacterium]|nr:HEAT repeat domain-containing protein [Pseudomonadota bacterium]